jgi:hypothetical protein
VQIGLGLMVIGFAKKVLIADLLAPEVPASSRTGRDDQRMLLRAYLLAADLRRLLRTATSPAASPSCSACDW